MQCVNHATMIAYRIRQGSTTLNRFWGLECSLLTA